MRIVSVLEAARRADPGVPETLVREPGLAVKALAVPGVADGRRLAPPGQGALLVVLGGRVEVREEGRDPGIVAPGEVWFLPGDRGASLRGVGAGGAVCALVATPVPVREPRRLDVLGLLAGRARFRTALVHRNEAALVEARRLAGPLPFLGHLRLAAGRSPRFVLALEGEAQASGGEGPPLRLATGSLLVLPPGEPAVFRARGRGVTLLLIEARKATSAPGSPRAAGAPGFDPFSSG